MFFVVVVGIVSMCSMRLLSNVRFAKIQLNQWFECSLNGSIKSFDSYGTELDFIIQLTFSMDNNNDDNRKTAAMLKRSPVSFMNVFLFMFTPKENRLAAKTTATEVIEAYSS